MLASIPFFVLLGVVTIVDSLTKLIPNYLVIIGLVYGLSLAFFQLGQVSFINSVLGVIVGGVLLIIPYAKSYIGAGDVKLMAMVGSYLGPYLTLEAVLYAAVVGGAVAACYLIYDRLSKKSTHKTVAAESRKAHLPYAFAISLGAIFALLKPNFL